MRITLLSWLVERGASVNELSLLIRGEADIINSLFSRSFVRESKEGMGGDEEGVYGSSL